MAVEHKGDNPLLQSLTTKQLKLSLIQLGSTYALPKAMLDRITVYHSWDPYMEAMVMGLKTYIHGMERERLDINIKYPEDWWQAVKERWFPKWALRRWPVKYNCIVRNDVLYSAVCPHIEAMPPRNTGSKVCIAWFAGLQNKEKDPYYGEYRNADGSPAYCRVCGTRLVGIVGQRCPHCEPHNHKKSRFDP